MDKAADLTKAKRIALAFFLVACAVFVTCLFLPRTLWTDGLRAVAEAAMIGALADWFAVVALFRRIPIPFIAGHTAIIPNNKDRIADNLARFVQEKFLDVPSLVALIRRHDPARQVADWLASPANADRLGGTALRLVGGALSLADDTRIQAFIKNAAHAAIDKVDLSRSAGDILDAFTRGGRHQALLDAGLTQVARLLQQPAALEFIAARVVEWLKKDHPWKERLLPSTWIGEHTADAVASGVNSLLDDVAGDPDHPLRRSFDDAVTGLIARLKTDPEFLGQGEALKRYLKTDEALGRYTDGLWASLREWLRQDLASEDSTLHRKASAAGLWLGQELAGDEGLRTAINQQLETAAEKMAPDFAQFLTTHIRDTVKNWDAQEMSWQVELNIGRDLQWIRINGTIVGGLIGLVLYLISHAPQIAASLRI